MSALTFGVLLLLVLTVINGVFSMAEIALVSSRRARLQQRAHEGDVKARRALELAETPGDFLSTVQIGITLIGILAGAYGEAIFAQPLATVLHAVPWLGRYSDAISFGLVVCLITYVSLVIGELVPKQLALHSPERIAASMAGPMQVVARLAHPLVRLLSGSTTAILRLLGIRPVPEAPVTEVEIKLLMQQGMQAGVFEEAEHEMVQAVFRLGDRRVGALMTPRTEMIWLDLDDTHEELQHKIMHNTQAQYVVGQGSLDDVRGVVYASNLLARCLTGQPVEFTTELQEPLFVPESMPALRLLESFKQSGLRIALVVDEYGSVQGVVTLEHMLEALVGDLPVAGMPIEPSAVQREDGSWLFDGLLPVDELKEHCHMSQLPREEEGLYQTLSGLVMLQLGHVPEVADHFDWAGWRFEVVDMDGRRVDKVLVAPIAPRAVPPAEDTENAL